MSLKSATVERLVEWQQAIVHELASRAAQPVAQQARPPWEVIGKSEMRTSEAPVQYKVQLAPEPVVQSPASVEMEQLRKAMLSLQQTVDAQQPRPAPQMLRGMVTPNSRTDPELAAKFVGLPARGEGLPPIQGNGRGQGEIGF